MPALKNFTSNLKDFYEKAGGKGSSFIRTLAKDVGVTPRTIHLLLEGTEPGLGLAIKIARNLGFSVESGKALDEDALRLEKNFNEMKKRIYAVELVLHAELKVLDNAVLVLERGLLPNGKKNESSAG